MHSPDLRAVLRWTFLLLSFFATLLPGEARAASGLPTIWAFNMSGSGTINRGESVELNWSVSNNTTEVSLSPGIGVVTGTSIVVQPEVTTTYVLTARNANGFMAKSRKITVIVPPAITSFTANPSTVTSGQAATLSWSAPGATYYHLAADVGNDPGRFTSRSTTVRPRATTTYTLTAYNSAGSSTQTLTLPVTTAAPRPVISSFAANPTSIQAGDSTTLTWQTTGATSLSISPGVGAVTGTSVSVAPSTSTTYVLTATNGAGSVTRSVPVAVTPRPSAPYIQAFQVSPPSIIAGESATLSWSVDGATNLEIQPDVGAVTGNSVVVSPTSTRTYQLIATNAGGSMTRSVTLEVLPPEPAPTIGSFTATPPSIARGASSTLTWSVAGATTVSILADVGASPGVVTGSSLVVSPEATTTYTLNAANNAGVIASRSVSVAVSAADAPPVIGSFVSWPNTVDYGQSTTLYWDVQGAASLVITAERGESPGPVTGARGSVAVTPIASTLYTMIATSPGGLITRSVTQVTVNAAPPPPVPVIESFTAVPSTISRGESATLNWTVTGADSLSISPEIGSVTGTSIAVNPTQTTTYTLTASNTYGPVTRNVTVNVASPAPPTINAFTANPGTIPLGGSTALSWNVTNATELSVTADVGASPGVVTGNSVTVSPTEDTIYTLHARNAHGEVTRELPVVVTGPTAPVISSFTATPAYIEIGSGGGSTLAWSVSGATRLTITADVGASSGEVTGNSLAVSPTATTVYTLAAENAVGTTTMTATVVLYTPGEVGQHPRIWLTPARVEQLAARARANDSAWIALRNSCDSWAAMPVRWPDESPASGYIHGGYQYYDYLRPMAELALGFQVAQQVDSVRAGRYAAKGREILLKMSDPVRHGRESTDSGWSIRAYVPALALGYDWLYPVLSPAERVQVFTEINRWVEWFDANGLSHDFPVGNYFAGYYSAKALGALATEGDNPKATAMWNDWLNRLHFSMVVPYHAAWLSGGSATDGWNYGPNETLNMVRPLVAALTAKGLDLINHPQHPFTYPNGHARWMAHFTWPDLSSVADRGFLYASSNPTPASAAWATHYAGLLRMANGTAAPIAQQYALDLRARPGRDTVEPWVEFLFHDASAPAENYRAALSYRTGGDGQVSMRNSWSSDTVWAAFQSGPYTGSPESAEMLYDQGSLTIQRGNVRFVVNAWGEMLRHTPGTTDGETRDPVTGERPFNQLYTELYGDSVDGYRQARRLFNTFYSYRTIRSGTIVGFFSQIGVGPDAAHTTLSKFEEGGRHVMMRATKLEDLYWDPEPILSWERSVVYVRPQLFFVYDRTRMSSASVDNWMSWNVAHGPEAVSHTPEAAVYDIVDRRAAFGGNLYRGRMTALLPVGRTVTPVNLFNRNKVHRLEIRPGTPATNTTWMTVFDAAASENAAGNALTLSAAAGNVLAGDVEGAVVATASGPNAAALFSRTGNVVSTTLQFSLPVRDTYCVISDLAPNASYTITSERIADRLIVTVTAGGARAASAQGVLAFDVSASSAELR